MSADSTFRHILMFSVVGGLAFLVDLGVFTGVNALGAGLLLSRSLSILAAVTFTWYFNRTLTFQTQTAPTVVEFLSYLAGMQIGLVTNFSTFFVVIHVSEVAARWPAIALAIATLAGMTLNFLISRKILRK